MDEIGPCVEALIAFLGKHVSNAQDIHTLYDICVGSEVYFL